MLAWDAQALLWINQHHSRWLDYVLYPISFAGEKAGLLVLLFVGMLWMPRLPRRDWTLWAGIGLALIILDRLLFEAITVAWFRDRPFLVIEGVRQVGPVWYTSSFPSGHAHYSWLVTVLFGAIRPRSLWLLVPFTLLTCYARPYFGMHYPMDVLIGSLTGIAFGAFAVLFKRAWLRHVERRTGAPMHMTSGKAGAAGRR